MDGGDISIKQLFQNRSTARDIDPSILSLHFSIFRVVVNSRERLKKRAFITKAMFYGQITFIKQQNVQFECSCNLYKICSSSISFGKINSSKE